MNKIVQTLAGVILEFVIVAALLLYMFPTDGGNGFLDITGNSVNIKAENFSTYKDSAATSEYAVAEKPVIKLSKTANIKKAVTYAYSDIFVSKEDLKNYTVKINSIVVLGDDTDKKYYDNENKTVCFDQSGQYTVSLTITDINMQFTNSKINIVVNR